MHSELTTNLWRLPDSRKELRGEEMVIPSLHLMRTQKGIKSIGRGVKIEAYMLSTTFTTTKRSAMIATFVVLMMIGWLFQFFVCIYIHLFSVLTRHDRKDENINTK